MRKDNQMAGLRQNPIKKKKRHIHSTTPMQSSGSMINLTVKPDSRVGPSKPKSINQQLYISSKLERVAHAFTNQGLL